MTLMIAVQVIAVVSSQDGARAEASGDLSGEFSSRSGPGPDSLHDEPGAQARPRGRGGAGHGQHDRLGHLPAAAEPCALRLERGRRVGGDDRGRRVSSARAGRDLEPSSARDRPGRAGRARLRPARRVPDRVRVLDIGLGRLRDDRHRGRQLSEQLRAGARAIPGAFVGRRDLAGDAGQPRWGACRGRLPARDPPAQARAAGGGDRADRAAAGRARRRGASAHRGRVAGLGQRRRGDRAVGDDRVRGSLRRFGQDRRSAAQRRPRDDDRRRVDRAHLPARLLGHLADAADRRGRRLGSTVRAVRRHLLVAGSCGTDRPVHCGRRDRHGERLDPRAGRAAGRDGAPGE